MTRRLSTVLALCVLATVTSACGNQSGQANPDNLVKEPPLPSNVPTPTSVAPPRR